MRVRADGAATRGDLLLPAVCVVLSLIALALPDPWTRALTGAIRETALRPLVAMQARANRDRTSRFELRGIEQARDSLTLLVQAQAAVRRENDNLRALAGLRGRLEPHYLAAEVLHRPIPTDGRTLLLNVGADSGVAQFDPIVAPEGLVGYVWSTTRSSSVALAWFDPEFRASAVSEDGEVYGVIAPSEATLGRQVVLELRGVALRDSLAIGAVIYTAGLGGVFPRYIPIGKVIAAGTDEMGYERVYTVAPFVNPGTATHVLILTAPRDSVFLPLPTRGAALADSVQRADSVKRAADSLAALKAAVVVPPAAPPVAGDSATRRRTP